MKKVRILTIVFDNEIKPYEVEAFRGAVIHKAGLEHDIFHNHQSDGKSINRYPFIQYKQIKNKPCLFCIEQGVDEVHHFFTNKNWEILISGRKLNLKIDKLDLKTLNLQAWDKMFNYSMYNWIALNSANYQTFKQLTNDDEKKELLKSILIGNILSMAKTIQWNVNKNIELKINEIKHTKPIKYKNTKMIGFDINFQCNVFLPNYIGLGKGASHGMGVLKQIKKEVLVNN